MGRRWITALVAALVTVGVVAVPGASYAASGLHTTAGWFDSDNFFNSALDADQHIGDCTLIRDGLTFRTNVYLGPPNGANLSHLHLAARSSTSHTNNADIWRVTLTFITDYGTTIVTTPQFSSVDMKTLNYPYEWHIDRSISVDPALFSSIRLVRWASSC
jgi:hypothetical protein